MMPRSAFEEHAVRYDEWFSKNPGVYDAELKAVAALLPEDGLGIEIGVGTGRFASRLGIPIGLDPSGRMLAMTRARGVQVVAGVAERLPFPAGVFSFALMATTICFFDDVHGAFLEAYRVLIQNGSLLVAFVDRNSPVGQLYELIRDKSVFYQRATFHSTEEVLEIMRQTGFSRLQCRQTLFRNIAEPSGDEPVLPGYGRGSFIVVRGEKNR